MQYLINGHMDIYFIEDTENEIGVIERHRRKVKTSPLFNSSSYETKELHEVVGKLSLICSVEPENWEVTLFKAPFTIKGEEVNLDVIRIKAIEYIDSYGQPIDYTKDLVLDIDSGEYIDECRYTAYIFRQGYEKATESDLNQVKKIVKALSIDESELDKCFEECFNEDDFENEE
jgi:hypothetical protein